MKASAPSRYTAVPDGSTFAIIDTLTGQGVGVAEDTVAAERAVQRLNSFLLANEYRIDRSRLRREIKALDRNKGAARLGEMIALDPPCMDSLAVAVALVWVHSVREHVARRFLRQLECTTHPPVRISELRSVGSLTVRERSALAEHLSHPWVDSERVAA